MLARCHLSQLGAITKSRNTAVYRVARVSSATRKHGSSIARAVSGVSRGLPYSANPEIEEDLGECTVASVMVDNDSHEKYTVLDLQAPDQPGLVRVLSWVLNGMSVRVHHGKMRTTPDGVAHDRLWVTDFRNHKLNDMAAESLGSRIEDFMISCGVSTAVTEKRWICGAIEVSNEVHPDLTEVIIRGEPSAHKPGFLLELTTALTGVGVSIQEATIQGGPDVPEPALNVAGPDYDFNREGRFFKFMVKGPKGGQMDADRVSSLIFTLRLLEGKGTMPTVAPNMDALLKLGHKCT